MKLHREPIQWTAALSAAIQLVTALLLPLLGITVSVDQQGLISAVVTALCGLLAAWRVSQEKAAPFVAGLVQSLIAVAVSFGVHLDPAVQSSLMTIVAALYSAYLRTQVTAAGRHDAR